MALSSADKKRLRAAAHPLKPVVMIGQRGYTPAIVAALDEALFDHELVKLRLRGIERAQRQALINEICRDLNADFVGLIGTVATFYRVNSDNATR